MCPSPTRPSAQRVGRVLVTGASGNVGRHVVSSLAAAGQEVLAFVRDPDKAPAGDGVEVVSGDLTSPPTLVPALREVDRVFLVWPGLPVDAGVVDALADHASRVVYLSTDVSDLADDEPATSFQLFAPGRRNTPPTFASRSRQLEPPEPFGIGEEVDLDDPPSLTMNAPTDNGAPSRVVTTTPGRR